jgi:molybdate transport system permease protein
MNFSEEEWTAIRLSIEVASLAVAWSLPFGILVAWLLARGQFYGKALLSGIVASPLILPPVVTGYLLLMAFGRKGLFGGALESIGIVLSFRWTGAAVAAAVMGFPLLVQAIQLSMEAIDRRLEQAAGTLGANPLMVFLTVTLPLSLPGIIAGMVLCFAHSR